MAEWAERRHVMPRPHEVVILDRAWRWNLYLSLPPQIPKSVGLQNSDLQVSLSASISSAAHATARDMFALIKIEQ
jgi:hypothetical protein